MGDAPQLRMSGNLIGQVAWLAAAGVEYIAIGTFWPCALTHTSILAMRALRSCFPKVNAKI
jgi:hypothetical protein